jgi:hypothetical protein
LVERPELEVLLPVPRVLPVLLLVVAAPLWPLALEVLEPLLLLDEGCAIEPPVAAPVPPLPPQPGEANQPTETSGETKTFFMV